MAPKDTPRGNSSGSNPPKDTNKQQGKRTPTPAIHTTHPSTVLKAEDLASVDQNRKWLTTPLSDRSGDPTAPSCSQVAANASWSMAVLHELGAYCVGLPPDDDWESKKAKWPTRERLNERFIQFRSATGTRRWDQQFENPTACGVTAPLVDLHTALCTNAATKFKNGARLDDKVLQYLLPRIAVILQAVARAQRFLRLKGVDGLAAIEADYRLSIDQLLDDLLNNEPDNRSTVIERTLNFARNEIYDEVAASSDGPMLTSSTTLDLRKREHVAFRRYLAQGVEFYGGNSSADTIAPNSYQLGKTALLAIHTARETQDEKWKLVFFRELISMRLKEEDANVNAWEQLPMTLVGRLRVSPRTGKCDAINFLHLKVNLNPPGGPVGPDGIRRLRECSLVRLTEADVKADKKHNDDGESLPKDLNDLAAYQACSQLERRVNLGNVNDVIGHASLYADLEDPPAPTPQTTTRDPASTGLPLLLPVLLYEYKKNFKGYSPSGLFQLRLYLNATCRFLEKLGVTNFMTFGVLTEGTQVVVIGAWRDTGRRTDPAMTWIVDQYTAKYDISKPQDAFQFACFVVWVKVVHMPVLEGLLTKDKLNLFAERVLAGQMNWTMYHQNPPKTKNTNTNTNTNTTPPAGGAQ